MEQAHTEVPHADLLMKEYELCQDSAKGLEATVWQSATLAGLGSIAALIAAESQVSDRLIATLIGAIAVTSLWTWWGIARRWWSIQHIKLLRMAHIELILRVPSSQRYLRFLDDYADQKMTREYMRASAEERRRMDSHLAEELGLPADIVADLIRERSDHARSGTQELLIILPVVTSLAWLVYVLAVWGCVHL